MSGAVLEPGPGTFLVVPSEEGDTVLKRIDNGWLTWQEGRFFPFPMPWSSVDARSARLATMVDLMKVGCPPQ